MKTWRPIAGFEGLYDVSSNGDVRNARTGRVLKPNRFPNGYLGVQLGVVDGKRNICLVHRLVAAAFIPGNRSLQVNHKNGVRSDNRAANLEWITCSDNHLHSYRNLNRKQHAKTAPVMVGGVVYPSRRAAAKALGVSSGSVCSAINRGHLVKGMEARNV